MCFVLIYASILRIFYLRTNMGRFSRRLKNILRFSIGLLATHSFSSNKIEQEYSSLHVKKYIDIQGEYSFNLLNIILLFSEHLMKSN